MTPQQFGQHYPYHGGVYVEGECYWAEQDIEKCLQDFNNEWGPDFNPVQKPWDYLWWNDKYKLYWGFWTNFIAFPIEPSHNMFILNTPRVRKNVDEYTSWLINYYKKIEEDRDKK